MQYFCYYRTYNSFAVLCSNNYVLLTFNRTLHVSNLKKNRRFIDRKWNVCIQSTGDLTLWAIVCGNRHIDVWWQEVTIYKLHFQR